VKVGYLRCGVLQKSDTSTVENCGSEDTSDDGEEDAHESVDNFGNGDTLDVDTFGSEDT
jgi:hypothetical protein